jgi:5'-nucleotidase/UDP-sugar diphosphatase
MAHRLFLLLVGMFVFCSASGAQATASGPSAAVRQKPFHVLFTNDWQSRIGEIARLETLLKEKTQAFPKDEPVFRFDAGDISMGTLFHTITREVAPELQLAALLKYTALCFGNHEFDFHLSGVVQMIRSAIREVGAIPPILATNLVFSNTPEDADLRKLMDEGVLRRQLILEEHGIRFGIIGIMGKGAGEATPNSKPVSFADPVETAKHYVKKLREEEHVDYTIVLSHSGVFRSGDLWTGEDVDLASQVSGIDLIIGGHSHTVLFDPIMVNNIPILQAGSEMRYLGTLSASKNANGLQVDHHHLIPIDTTIPADSFIASKVSHYKKEVDRLFLSHTPYRFDQPILQLQQDYTRGFEDTILGYWVTDSMRKRVQADIGFTGNGTVRDDLKKGLKTVSDLFQVVPLGIGILDREPGYPIVRMFFTGKELKQILEVLLFAYQTKKTADYYPRFSGIQFTYNPYRIFLDRISTIRVGGVEIDPSDPQKLYSLATTSYVGEFLWLVDELSHGLFHVEPKDAQGKPIVHIQDAIVNKDPASTEVKEIKEWEAFLEYVTQLGTPTQGGYILAEHTAETLESPMIMETSLSPRSLFYNSTWIQQVAASALSLLFFLFAWGCRAVIRRFAKR